MHCPNCQETQLVKNGTIHNGKPKWKCKACGRQFVANPTQRRIRDDTKQLIDKLLLERVLLALNRDTREIVGMAIGARSKAIARRLWASLAPVYRQCAVCYTDFWKAYAAVFPSKRHRAVGKESGQTSHIERFNNTLRQRCSRLVRKTFSFSKSSPITLAHSAPSSTTITLVDAPNWLSLLLHDYRYERFRPYSRPFQLVPSYSTTQRPPRPAAPKLIAVPLPCAWQTVALHWSERGYVRDGSSYIAGLERPARSVEPALPPPRTPRHTGCRTSRLRAARSGTGHTRGAM
jgi:insertion element IS1 protein InsB